MIPINEFVFERGQFARCSFQKLSETRGLSVFISHRVTLKIREKEKRRECVFARGGSLTIPMLPCDVTADVMVAGFPG